MDRNSCLWLRISTTGDCLGLERAAVNSTDNYLYNPLCFTPSRFGPQASDELVSHAIARNWLVALVWIYIVGSVVSSLSSDCVQLYGAIKISALVCGSFGLDEAARNYLPISDT